MAKDVKNPNKRGPSDKAKHTAKSRLRARNRKRAVTKSQKAEE